MNTLESKFVMIVEQYLNGKWVTLLKNKTKPCTRLDASNDVKILQKLFYETDKVENICWKTDYNHGFQRATQDYNKGSMVFNGTRKTRMAGWTGAYR